MGTIKVNKIENRTGSTLELGGPGTAVTLACGATQTGFGRTGTVDWCTTAKTSPFTAVSGDGFFVNTSGGAITVTLPSSPSAGDIVALKDYANTWDTNNVTLCRNGSKINGICANSSLNTESQSVTLIYVDGTKGWQDIHDSTSNVTGLTHVVATGGTETTCGDFRIHTFTSDGNFVVTYGGQPCGSNSVEYLVVAGGAGGGGDDIGAGGGAGGFRFASPSIAPLTYPAKPLAGPANLPVSVQTYPVVVGAGGTNGSPSCRKGGAGGVSTFSSITSAGGGGGGGGNNDPGPSPNHTGGNGGSGGGGGFHPSCRGQGGNGNTPPVSPPQGNDGGDNPASSVTGGGGGGATAVGSGGPGSGSTGANGGAGGGLPTAFGSNGVPCGSFRYYAGGGAGTGDNPPFGSGGLGGGGVGGPSGSSTPGVGGSGTANTGGGGGGAGGNGATSGNGGSGGSGVVVIRYKFQN